MEKSPLIVNVPQALMDKALLHAVTSHKALAALDAGLDVVLIEDDITLANEYAVAVGNAWSLNQQRPSRPREASFFAATDWHKYAKNNRSPTSYHRSFTHFFSEPVLLIVVGLSFMQTAPARGALDEALHRRAMAGSRSVLAGWKVPTGNFAFSENQELAIDTRSEFPLLHQRAQQASLTLLTNARSK
jgi:hypothetical protein